MTLAPIKVLKKSKAEAEKAEQERLEKEAEEAKATANTRLLEEIRDTLKALSEKG